MSTAGNFFMRFANGLLLRMRTRQTEHPLAPGI